MISAGARHRKHLVITLLAMLFPFEIRLDTDVILDWLKVELGLISHAE